MLRGTVRSKEGAGAEGNSELRICSGDEDNAKSRRVCRCLGQTGRCDLLRSGGCAGGR